MAGLEADVASSDADKARLKEVGRLLWEFYAQDFYDEDIIAQEKNLFEELWKSGNAPWKVWG